jgi:RHS repeat-associated protein
MDRLKTRTDPLGRVERYTYDVNGNLTEFMDRKEQVARLVYDELDRVMEIQYADNSITKFDYDAAGRLVQTDDSQTGSMLFTYDRLDRLVQEVTGQGTVQYDYDALDRRTRMAIPGQRPVTYGYDIASQLRQITQGAHDIALDYDAAGRRESLTLPNGVVTAYEWDTASQLQSITHTGPAGVLEKLTYHYDRAGSRTSVTRQAGAAALSPAPLKAEYDAANRLLQLNSSTPNFTYDKNGNLTSHTDANGTTTYTWDARDRLASLSGPGVSASFVYDAFGRRISKTINGLSTDYQYDVDDIVAEFQDRSVEATYLASLNIDEPLIRQSTSPEYYHTDALGSTVAMSDANGALTTRYRYGPFGRTTATGTSENPFQYTGRENDGTGLYYYRARYYHPDLQRFLSEDPIEFLGGNINLYAYVGNDPVNYTDPSGECWLPGLIGGALWGTVGNLGDVALGGRKFDWGTLAGDVVIGAAGGAFSCGLSKIPGLFGKLPGLFKRLTRGNNQGFVGTPKGPVSMPNGPDFIVTPKGDVVPVPKGATGPIPTRNGKGFQYIGGKGGNGLHSKVSGVRIMDPNSRYPGGRVTYMNSSSQTVNPYTGHTIPPSDPAWHRPLTP